MDMSKKTTKEVLEAGFTLVEMMAVLAIMSLLVITVVVNLRPALDRGNATKAKADIRAFEQALELYRLDMLDYPPETAGLAALKTVPSGIPNADRYSPGGYVSNSIPKDPWGRDYLYRYPGQNGVYDVFSYGQDGQEGGEGPAADIVNWEFE